MNLFLHEAATTLGSFWDDVRPILGDTATDLLSTIMRIFYIVGLAIGVVAVIWSISSAAIKDIKEHDTDKGKAVTVAIKNSTKGIVILVICAFGIPIIWEIITPIIITAIG